MTTISMTRPDAEAIEAEYPLYLSEFGPDFTIEPEILEQLESNGFEDDSWHNNICPSFTKAFLHHGRPDGRCVTIWVDAENPEDREMTAERFLVQFHEAYDNYEGNHYTESFAEALQIALK